LAELKAMLELTEPHFIRCLKPNDLKKPQIFQSKLILEQLRYSGIAAVISVRQQGFPVRSGWQDFYERYYIIDKTQFKDFWPARDECKEASVKLLDTIRRLNPNVGDLVQIGRTKVFMRGQGVRGWRHGCTVCLRVH
jgi:myosin heavy subunit